MIPSAATPVYSGPREAGGPAADAPGLAISPARVLEMLPAAVVVLDGAGHVRQCNPAALDLLGAPLLGQPWHDVLRRAFVADCGSSSGPLLRDGRRVRVATRAAAPLPGQIVLLAEDAEAAGEQPAATAAVEAAAVLAHQIRTPLAAAVLYAGHMTRPLLETQDRLRLAGKLRAALGHLERLVNDILLCVRAGRGEKRPLALSSLIHELCELTEPWLREQGCRLACPQEIPPLVLPVQREALRSALENLVVNAAEACGRGGCLELEVRCDGPQAVEFVLSDNGPGVPPGLEARIFEPFFTTRANGTGLGLALVRAVALAHGGDVHYAPRAGGGAQFTLRIPISPSGESV